MKTYRYDLDKDGFKKLSRDLSTLKRNISSYKFKKYLANKCLDALVQIQEQSLTSINNDDDIFLSDYMSSNHFEIGEDVIIIYNDAVVDVSSKNMSDEKKANYPNLTISLAKIVEYGIGYTGLNFTPHKEEVEDWEYDVNNYGERGWYYRDDDNVVHWTNGFEGRMIFYQLKKKVEEKMLDWIAEYWVDEATKDLGTL